MAEQNFLALIDSRADEIKALLPKYLTPERFFILAREVEKNPQLRTCTPQSLFDCVLKAAQCGLELGTVDQHCFVIPYGKEAQLQIGYRGMIFRLVQAGVVSHMYADIIRKNDSLEITSGSKRELIHRFSIGDRGDVIGAYSVATMPNGSTDFELMEMKDLEAIEKAALRISGGKPSPAWSYFKTEMQKKSVIRRHAKRLQGDRRGLMKEDEATRLDMVFETARRVEEPEPPDDIPHATDGTPAPTPPRKAGNVEVVADKGASSRKQPSPASSDDRPLNTGEVDELFEDWISKGGKRSGLAPFLKKLMNIDDLVEVKLSEKEVLKEAMAQELS